MRMLFLLLHQYPAVARIDAIPPEPVLYSFRSRGMVVDSMRDSKPDARHHSELLEGSIADNLCA